MPTDRNRRNLLLAATATVWGVAYVAWTADWSITPMPFPLDRALRRVAICLFGFAQCLGIIRLLDRADRQALARRLAVAAGLCMAASLLQSLLSELVYHQIAPRWGASSVADFVERALSDLWVYFAWAALYFAIDDDARLRRGALRLADTERALLSAQNRALLRQIQPHFLFNTLNAISGLVLEGERERADRTVTALARLLRATMATELPSFRTLEAELDAQHAYLDIQAARFENRFELREEVPAELRALEVPSLILQPLVENAFTHGVARTTAKVTITIAARRCSDGVEIAVSDDAAGGVASRCGTGLGLANVRERLQLLYGAASVDAAPLRPHGWSTRLRIPAAAS
jgi:two-component system, LytTR family, sensor kinase